MSTRRIVMTAAGVVSPIGREYVRFGDNLLAGVQGVRSLAPLYGDEYSALPVRYGGLIDDGAVRVPPALLRFGRLHRSILFAADAIEQLARGGVPPGISQAGLYTGVGLGQLHPTLHDLREYGARRLLALADERSNGGLRTLPDADAEVEADHGTAVLRQAFGLEGPFGALAGACSASTQACIAACEDVLAGATYAIGGGHDSMLHPGGLYFMYTLGTLSPSESADGRIVRPFDIERDGTLVGEGAAYFLFEDYAHASARRAPILAEVLGWGSSLDGHHITSPDPGGDAATRMIGDALEQARLPPTAIDYVNAHGTATVLNDTIEAGIIKRALQGRRAYVSSTKAQAGHLIAACGALGMAAGLTALERQQVPPNPNLSRPDPECDVRLAPAASVPAPIDHVLCNAFGFGGQNSCMVLRSARAAAGARA